MDRSARIEEFLAGLTELSKKTGISLASCGCCGSPWLEHVLDFDHYHVCENGNRLRAIDSTGDTAAVSSTELVVDSTYNEAQCSFCRTAVRKKA